MATPQYDNNGEWETGSSVRGASHHEARMNCLAPIMMLLVTGCKEGGNDV